MSAEPYPLLAADLDGDEADLPTAVDYQALNAIEESRVNTGAEWLEEHRSELRAKLDADQEASEWVSLDEVPSIADMRAYAELERLRDSTQNGSGPDALARDAVAGDESRQAGRLVATPLTVVAMRSIVWLERPLWQGSAFQLLAGAKGSGKGTYLAGLAARITHASSNVVFISSEDSTEIDLKPRLVAAGADITRCFCIPQNVRLPDDIDDLRGLANAIGGVGLLVIDPVANHIGDRSSNSDTEVRHAIGPLNALADELGCLLIGVRHPGKDRSRGALASILGSTAWVDTPRAVVMVAVDDEDPLVRHVQVVAGNRSLNGSAQAFRIEAVDVEGLTEPITRAVELGESTKSVDDLIGAKADGKTTVSSDLIQAVILEALATGEKSRDYLDEACFDELGVSPNTVYKRGLMALRGTDQIRARKGGMNEGWHWRLKEPE